MCLNPLKLPTNARVISRFHLQKVYHYIPCGVCSECQMSKSREWLFRARWQFEEVKKHNGFALFDTLTYSNENLPYLSHFLGPASVDYPCFSLPDIQGFFNRFRAAFRRKFHYSSSDSLPFKYFLCSEYGTDEKCTHRPHYHLILYVFDSSINPLDLSFMISNCWNFGRTDGAKYKGKRYVLENRVIRAHTKNADSIHLHEYVAKYVEKDCEFSKVIHNRLYSFMLSKYDEFRASVGDSYCRDSSFVYDDEGFPICNAVKSSLDDDFLEWLRLPSVHSLFIKTKHLVEQFHKQSQGFGSYLLEDDNLDCAYLWKTGCVRMRNADKDATFSDIPLPTYYYRKIFQEQVYIGRYLCWQHTELGKQYKEARIKANIENLALKIKSVFAFHDYHTDLHYYDLAVYSVVLRDTIGSLVHVTNLDDKLKNDCVVSYQNKNLYRGRYVSAFLQDDEFYLSDCVPLVDFIAKYKNRLSDYLGYDEVLDKFQEFLCADGIGRQERYESLQKRRKLLKKQSALPL